jgi:hypothetical protein
MLSDTTSAEGMLTPEYNRINKWFETNVANNFLHKFSGNLMYLRKGSNIRNQGRGEIVRTHNYPLCREINAPVLVEFACKT